MLPMERTHDGDTERRVGLEEIGDALSGLRLRSPESVRELQQSMVLHGQMTAAVAFVSAAGGVELIDGFKRLQACRELGWRELRVRVLRVSAVEAKAAVEVLNRHAGLTELEEGWLVRSLYRDESLSQPQIGHLLSRHKSWVCRRLMLVEALDEAVQADVRLGLLAARTAVAVARLPRGNQPSVAAVVARRGLTTPQTERLVSTLLEAPSDADRHRIVAEATEGRGGWTQRAARGDRRPPATVPAARIVSDILRLIEVAARLESRLLERPIASLGADAAETIRRHLRHELGPVLSQLQGAITRSAGSAPEEEKR